MQADFRGLEDDGMIERLKKLTAVAAGREAPDMVLKGGRVVNVFSGDIIAADVAVSGGWIAGIGSYDGPHLWDVRGGLVCPGFIDGHLHLESTMLAPPELARAVLAHGTTALVADPHEIANVMGNDGIRYFLDCAAGLPVDIYFMLPSCVPATHLETSGSRLEASDLLSWRGEPAVLGLAEVMNYPAVVNGDERMLAKVAAFADLVVDGHAPLLTGKDLNAYAAAGIRSDHECTDLEEAREKLRLGMHIMIREGTLAKNMRTLLPLVAPHCLRQFSLVCDDLNPADLLYRGHLDHILTLALEAGLDPISALMMVTYNTARYFGLKDRGAVAPGYRADMTILASVHPAQVQGVVKSGRPVFKEGELLCEVKGSIPPGGCNTMNVRPWEPASLAIPWEGSEIRVIDLIPDQLLTREVIVPTEPRRGLLEADPQRDILKIAVVERHRKTGNIGRGMVRGFGLKRGALASSVAHDSHNILCVGVNDKDMHLAAKTVETMQGGLAVVADGEVKASLPLPIAGLMSAVPLPNLVANREALVQAAKSLGCAPADPFMTLSFLALPVIPELKITDLGLVDVRLFGHVPLFIHRR
jgi:adenine deaminase